MAMSYRRLCCKWDYFKTHYPRIHGSLSKYPLTFQYLIWASHFIVTQFLWLTHVSYKSNWCLSWLPSTQQYPPPVFFLLIDVGQCACMLCLDFLIMHYPASLSTFCCLLQTCCCSTEPDNSGLRTGAINWVPSLLKATSDNWFYSCLRYFINA